ncbi:deoxyribodipyrimidine photo-lyase [Halovenus sp. WSH3]|uniref:Deoxyribodipyrimidine photo-lyase n=1 Tax=Halovenus carboxidivorans TaxID=2692199 RepID=A0A6B0SXR0_9EURY|nr:deoxyribodipyrimidine photo-lyase [Halovenus carboxidivorans]MXR50518.1 deoxyribodipyrimidine photo-lyase [Halovenus carboxidivorans]
MQIHWHRRDLRLADNRGLDAATADDAVGLFVFDPTVLTHGASPRVAFMLDALESLRAAYRDRDSDLLIAHGNPTELVPGIAAALDADGVTWCTDYTGLARRRDAAVRQALDDAGIERTAVQDAVHHEPGEITTNDGDPYKVFTYFSKKWHDREKLDPLEPPTADDLAAVESGEVERTRANIPTLDELGFEEPDADLPEASTEAARERLREFCAEDIYRYDERRDYPADRCTSRLSVHLKYGTIGVREVYDATDRARADGDSESERESVFEFQDQLAWREFYTQVLWDRPDAVTENYKSYEHEIEWREDPEALEAWKRGETGYPIVDAGMRQLREEAYMHNRVRMIVASFLTKDLLIDWREGYDWFREQLVDHDTANDNGGWQWAASTGTDAQPYFRVFNPMTQGERYDPDAEYIREYVPELEDVPAETIHSWHELDIGTRKMHASEYPAPIVDHSERREEAIAMFERARGDE